MSGIGRHMCLLQCMIGSLDCRLFLWLAKVDTKNVVLRHYDNNKPPYGVFSSLHLLFYNEITICPTSDKWPSPFLRFLSGGYFRARSADAQFPPSELEKVSWHFSFSWLVAPGVFTENYKRRENVSVFSVINYDILILCNTILAILSLGWSLANCSIALGNLGLFIGYYEVARETGSKLAPKTVP